MKFAQLGVLALVLSLGLAPGASAPANMPMPPGMCDALKAEFNKFAPTDVAQYGPFLNRVAWQFRAQGFGLSRKDFGNFAGSPAGPIAFDIIAHRDDFLFDVVSSGGDPGATVNCGPGEKLDRSTDPAYWKQRPFVPPVDPGGAVDPGPTKHPYDGGSNDTGFCDTIINGSPCMRRRTDPLHGAPPPPPPLEDCRMCEAAKLALETANAMLQDDLTVSDREQLRLRDETTARGARIRDLEVELEKLKAQPAGSCKVNGPGWVRSTFRITCTVTQ